ncbi:MAG: amidohydrolase [SAR202 cluster bacterium]|nr:amidohydrolase [SAR202 cluster bacterium]
MKERIISGDSHIDLRFLPSQLFTDNARPNLRGRMPRVVDTPNGRRWMAGIIDMGVVGVEVDKRTFSTEMSHRWKAMQDGGFFDDLDKGYHPTNAELRIRDQDKDGIRGEVLYGPLRVAATLKDPELGNEFFRVYNDWLAGFCHANPDRFAGLACLPNHDPKVAADELRRVAKIGLKGADLGVGGAPKPIYHKDWDVLWKAADETRLPISFHTTGLVPMRVSSGDGPQYDEVFHNIRTVLFQLSGAEFATSAILSGACQRFPNFKFVLGECGVSWLPYVLDRMDHECEGTEGLKLKPSEYWARQGFTTFQMEPVAGDLVPMVGEDNVIWGSDYPHQDGVWPDSLKTIDQCLGSLNPKARRKVVCDNTARLYGFKT